MILGGDMVGPKAKIIREAWIANDEEGRRIVVECLPSKTFY